MALLRKYILNHEEDRYKELFYAYYYRVFIYIARRVKGKENIMDITQNVFFHLWQYRTQLKLSNADSIIFNTCNQEISKFMRSIEKEPVHSADLGNRDKPDDSAELLKFKLKKEQRIEAIKKSIELLPPLRKKIFLMNKFEGITQEQIAVELHIPHHTVKYHISEAMLFLKNFHKNS